MHIKIFFGSKPLFLCDRIEDEVKPYVHHDDTIFIDELNLHTIKTMIHEMQLAKVHAGVFLHPDFEELKKAFFKKFTEIIAGGGVVANENDEILLIFRKGSWDLPKGKLDKGETIPDCALREVSEETGLKDVKAGELLMITYHTYHEGTKFILKASHWYAMEISGIHETVPQEEEGITAIKWVKPESIPGYYDKAYPAVVDVLKKFLEGSP